LRAGRFLRPATLTIALAGAVALPSRAAEDAGVQWIPRVGFDFEHFGETYRITDDRDTVTVINDYGTMPASIPFGGYKHSGIGRENGHQAIDHYTQIKTIYTNLEPVDRYM